MQMLCSALDSVCLIPKHLVLTTAQVTFSAQMLKSLCPNECGPPMQDMLMVPMEDTISSH